MRKNSPLKGANLSDRSSAGAILVDTGLHPSIATDPKANFGTLAARSGKPTLAAGEDVPSQLRERGLEPARSRSW